MSDSQNGRAISRPFILVGCSWSCGGRPLWGRARVRSFQNQTESLPEVDPPPRNHRCMIYVYGIRAAARQPSNSLKEILAMAKKLSVDRRKFLKGAAAGAAGF